jgi:hypothetical protein
MYLQFRAKTRPVEMVYSLRADEALLESATISKAFLVRAWRMQEW